MAKDIIDKAPFNFDPSLYNVQQNWHYIQKYRAEDQKGRYLYWDKFRWRVEKGDDPLIAWWATKLARLTQYKILTYTDKEEAAFVFS